MDHPDGLQELENQEDGSRARGFGIGARQGLPDGSEIQVGPGHPASFGGLPGSLTHGGQGQPRAGHEALLGGDHSEVQAPGVELEGCPADGGDAVHEGQGAMIPGHRGDLRHRVQDRGAGVRVDHQDGPGPGVGLQGIPHFPRIHTPLPILGHPHHIQPVDARRSRPTSRRTSRCRRPRRCPREGRS